MRLLTIHGGAKTAAAAKEGKGTSELKLLQVTLLTSLAEPDLRAMRLVGHGFGFASVQDYVAVRAETALANGADGLIARMAGQKTTLGAWLDPMADKLLLVTMFVVLTLPGLGLANRLPLWFTVLVISRDVVIVLSNYDPPAASQLAEAVLVSLP